MYLFQRAFSYIKKQKAKTALLLILFFIIANIVLAGLSIYNATETAKVLTRQEIGSDISYTTNVSKINADLKSGVLESTVDRATLMGVPLYGNFTQLLNDPAIESYDAITTYEVTTDLEAYAFTPSTSTTTSTPSTGSGGGGGGNRVITGTYTNSGDLSLRTFTKTQPTDFVNEASLLLNGRFASQEEMDAGALVVLIEETFASLNQISVGDTLELTPTLEGFNTVALRYEVIGIYQSAEVLDERASSMVASSLLPQNRMYVPFDSLSTIGLDALAMDAILLERGVITLSDPLLVETYLTSVEDVLDWQYGSLSASDALYEQLAGPIESLGELSSALVIIVAIAGAAILSLITALTINQRKNEIGVLLAIGESKFNIVTQFVVEVLAIALVAFTLSIFSGIQIGSMISESTLSNFTSETTIEQVPSRNNAQAVDVEAVDVEVGFDVLVISEFFVLGLLISIISVVIPALYVTRFNPKQILTQNG